MEATTRFAVVCVRRWCNAPDSQTVEAVYNRRNSALVHVKGFNRANPFLALEPDQYDETREVQEVHA